MAARAQSLELLRVGAALVVALALPATGTPDLEASTAFDDCEAELAADPTGWATCNCFYRVASATGLRDEAVQRLEGHRNADPDNPCLAFTLGRFRQEGREMQAAVSLYREAAERYRSRGLAAGEVYTRINLSQAMSELGEAGEHVAGQLERARLAAERSGDPVLEAEVAVKEAELLLRRGGELDLVEASLRRVRRDAFPQAHANLQRGILLALGDVLYRRGRFTEAAGVFAEAVEVTSAAGLRFAEAAARFNQLAAIGAGLPDPARHEEVVRLLEEALTAAQEAGNPVAEIEARERLGRLVGGPEGRAHLEAALHLAEAYRDKAPEILAGVLSASAMDLLPDDPDAARRRVDEASTLLLATDDPWAQAYGWADRLRVLWATAPREEALAAARSTLEIADRLGEIQETEEGRAEVFGVWTEIYQWLAGRLLADAERDGDPEALATAFEVAERMRARLLLESLAAAGVETAWSGLPEDPELATSWQALQRRVVDVHRRLLDPALASGRRDELLAKLAELEREESRLAVKRRRMRATAGATADDLAAPERFVGLDELRASLAADEALLAYQIGLWEALDGAFAGGAWLLAVTRDEVLLHRVPDRVGLELELGLNTFLNLFERRDGSEAESAPVLYDALLREALDSLPPGVDRLILVPDGPLHGLPFAAFREAPEAPPLAARYELYLTPSATAWHRLSALEEDGELALAVADPAAPGGVPAGEAVAGGERSWTAGVRLPRLPHAREEGREALRTLGEPGRLLLGTEATERAVKEGAGRGLRVLHFGTHAVLDEAYPHRSAVVLAPGAEDEDGLLRPREAADLGLGGAVVVLSACQSATGTVLQGEGALSLARAFLQGGARAVVGSLWPVEDEEAADLLGRFYRHLGRGDSVARALALAQRETLKAGAPAAAWAGWIVLGDGGAVVSPEGSSRGAALRRLTGWLGWVLALVLVLAATAAAIRRYRRRAV